MCHGDVLVRLDPHPPRLTVAPVGQHRLRACHLCLLDGLTRDGKVISLANTVGEVMREGAPQLPKETPIEEASAFMRQHPIVVITDNGRLRLMEK